MIDFLSIELETRITMMNTKPGLYLLLLIIFMKGISRPREHVEELPVLKVPYLGLKPPWMTQEVFESDLCFQ